MLHFHKNLPDLIKNKVFPNPLLLASFPSLSLILPHTITCNIFYLNLCLFVCLFNYQGVGFIFYLGCVRWEFDSDVVCCHSCFSFIKRHFKITFKNDKNICAISMCVCLCIYMC